MLYFQQFDTVRDVFQGKLLIQPAPGDFLGVFQDSYFTEIRPPECLKFYKSEGPCYG